MLYEKNGDNATAMRYMEDILKMEPDNAGALNFIGYSFAEKGINLDRAEELIKKALEKRPDDGYIIDSLGWVFYNKRRVPKGPDGDAQGPGPWSPTMRSSRSIFRMST